MRADMTDACTREGAERMEAEEARAALPKEIADALDFYRDALLDGIARRPEREAPKSRAALESAILADRERLAAESEARRLVLVLKATELRQAEAEAERLKWERATCDGSCDIALARRQVGPDGNVPGNAKECAHLWEQEAHRLEMERRDLAAQVKRWEDKEVARAAGCCGAEARAERAEEALRAVEAYLAEEEWIGWRSADVREDIIGSACCAKCNGFKADDHFVGCSLDAALSAARAVLSPLPAPQPDPEVKP